MLQRNFYILCFVVGSLSVASFAQRSLSTPTTVNLAPKANLVSMDTISTANEKGKVTAVFAGGCFWGMEAVFENLKGVSNVVSGYSGGSANTANYERVSTGQTEHAESVKVTFDPSQISYEQLLQIYFQVAHDPTELNRQGPDSGSQYRSAIFFENVEQKQIAESYIDRLNKSGKFSTPIVTQLVPLQSFYPAEDYHQDFIVHNPNYPYVVVNDLPKLAQLQKQFPEMVRISAK
jgi:peptide-methionine (S)-S-oxide reductase